VQLEEMGGGAHIMVSEQAKMGIVLVVDDDFDENIWRKITSIFVARENR